MFTVTCRYKRLKDAQFSVCYMVFEKGGFFGGKAFSADEVKALSDLPPRDILISQVIGAIAAPLSTLVGTIEALYADPIRVVGAVADKVAEEGQA